MLLRRICLSFVPKHFESTDEFRSKIALEDDLIHVTQLRGFERIHLKPGETKTVSLTLKPEDLALWDRQMHFVVEPGKFKVMIGSGSEDIRLTGEFTIASTK